MNLLPDSEGVHAGRSHVAPIGAFLVLLLIGLAYWSVRNGGFVWDDIINFVENDHLVNGTEWQHYLLRDFNGWTNYFRPLVVGLFAIQLRVFGGDPEGMHLTSLGLHLANATLVGLLAWRCAQCSRMSSSRVRTLLPLACMLLYGLHPALIEAVAWIGCQFDLVATFFMLLGTLGAVWLRPSGRRLVVVASCFFLAACSKESAAVFPALVLLVDWLVQSRQHTGVPRKIFLKAFFNRNAFLFIALILAGALYLLFRAWGLGYLLHDAPHYGGETGALGSIQKASYTYFQYWRLFFLPFSGIGPVHSAPAEGFGSVDWLLLAFAGISVAGISWAIFATLVHRSAWGGFILIVLVSLLPVLNLVPTGFAVSLYHERYIINALAFGIAVVPLLPWPRFKCLRQRTSRVVLVALTGGWIILSLMTIRGTLPLWMDDEALWRWALSTNQRHEVVQYNLVVALLRNNKTDDANEYVDRFSNGGECARCAIHVANMELDRGGLVRAGELIDYVKSSKQVIVDVNVYGDYLLTAGQFLAAKEQFGDAVDLLREGLAIHPEDIVANVVLAESLLKLGHHDEAVARGRIAIGIADKGRIEIVETWFSDLQQRASGDVN